MVWWSLTFSWLHYRRPKPLLQTYVLWWCKNSCSITGKLHDWCCHLLSLKYHISIHEWHEQKKTPNHFDKAKTLCIPTLEVHQSLVVWTDGVNCNHPLSLKPQASCGEVIEVFKFKAWPTKTSIQWWSLLTCSRPQWTGWRHQHRRTWCLPWTSPSRFGTHREWTAGLVQDNCRIQHRLHVRHCWCVPGTNRLVWGISSTEPCWSLLTCSRPQWTGWRHQHQRTWCLPWTSPSRFGTHREWTAGLVQDNCRIQHRLHVRHCWCVPGTNRLVWGISSTEQCWSLLTCSRPQWTGWRHQHQRTWC